MRSVPGPLWPPSAGRKVHSRPRDVDSFVLRYELSGGVQHIWTEFLGILTRALQDVQSATDTQTALFL